MRNRDIVRALEQFIDETPAMAANDRFIRYADGTPTAVFLAYAIEALPRFQRRAFWEEHPTERCIECGKQCEGHAR